MKTEIVSKMSRLSRVLLVATLALAGTASVKADNFFDNTISGINLGNASGGTTGGHRHWAIFTLGGNVTITDPQSYTTTTGIVPSGSPTSDYSAAGSADVYGNVGIYGSGRLSMTNSYIDGFVDEFSSPTNVLAGNGANPYFLGSITHDSAYLQQAYNDAIAASAAAQYLGTPAGLSANPTVVLGTATTAVITSAKSEADLGITGSLAGNTYVLNLTDLILQGTSAVLTLNGTATTNYVINVNRYMSLAGGAKINLAGTITPQNVLYNVNQNTINGVQYVQYDVTLSGGSEARGIILATTRAVKLTGDSKVFGEVIAKSVSLSGSSNVINPLVSP